MTDREKYLAFHNVPPELADEAWAAKEAMDRGFRMMSAPMIFVSRDICYDSPVDGRPITNKHARIEDLARSGCIEYDPEMKTDYSKRVVESEQKLEKQVDETVERAIATLPARQREKLEAEMQGGLTCEPQRVTPQQESFKNA